tara:strand:- start:762 stop:1382 length:621 start_codon:yes stop_codon:yes gene_type:complete
MKLYYAPGACSLASHIVLKEIGKTFSIEKVDLKNKTTETGENYAVINPKGYIPAIRLDDGELLTEGTAILQYLADQTPESKLAPANGTMPRVRLQETLNFITSELHKSFAPLFSQDENLEPAREAAREKLTNRFGLIEADLSDGREFITGDNFTIADAYLFTVASWGAHVGFNLEAFPGLEALIARISTRPAVQAALQAEGLLKAA